MEGAATYGIDWSKVPTQEEVRRTVDVAKNDHPEKYHMAFHTAMMTGLRVAEIAHLKCDDLLPGNRLRYTPRKKRVLKQRIIDVFPSWAESMAAWIKDRRGWMFPGDAAPCIIHRMPKFEETHCPDCGRHLLRLDQVRKKCDRVQNFANHMTQEHSRTPDEVAEWVWFASKEIHEPFCDGGHIHVRSLQSRFRLAITQAGAYVPGRGIHSFRHAFAVDVYAKTKDIMTVKQLLGHENISTTTVYSTAVDVKEKLSKLDGRG